MKIVKRFLVGIICLLTSSLPPLLASDNPFETYLGEYNVTAVSRCLYDYEPTQDCQISGVGVRPDGENGVIYIYEIDAQGNSVGYPLYERIYEDELGREEAQIDRPSADIARWTHTLSLVDGRTVYESRTLMRGENGEIVYRYALRNLPMFGDEHTVERIFQLKNAENI